MYVNIDKRYFICFKCETSNRKADVFDFISETEGLTRGQSIKQCILNYSEVCPSADEIAEALEEKEHDEEEEDNTDIKVIESLPSYAQKLSRTDENPAISYLLERGLTVTDIEDMQTHHIPNGNFPLKVGEKFYGNMQNRVLWPIYGGNNKLVSWIARSFDPRVSERKYINCPKSELAKTFWPYVPPRTQEVVLVEGILDCLAVRRLGFDCYATFGKHTSREQISLLIEWEVQEITLCYDYDAKKDMLGLIDDLKLNFALFVPQTVLPGDADAGDTLKDEGLRDQLLSSLTNAIQVDTTDFLKWEMFA